MGLFGIVVSLFPLMYLAYRGINVLNLVPALALLALRFSGGLPIFATYTQRLIPATIALGSFTFTMTALPGAPAGHNAIPMPFLGTTPFAAPLMRLLAAAIATGEGFGSLGV